MDYAICGIQRFLMSLLELWCDTVSVQSRAKDQTDRNAILYILSESCERSCPRERILM